MNDKDEKKTEQLRKYVDTEQDIRDIEEDTQFLYFNTTNIHHPMMLRQLGYETYYQDRHDDYHVRILKPNWFSHDFPSIDTN